MLAAVLATSGLSSVVTAALHDFAWSHALVLLAASLQSVWLCWVSMGAGLVPRDERPVAWRRRDAVRMAVATALAGTTLLSSLMALRHALPADLAVAFCLAAGFAACTGAFSLGRLLLIGREWRKRRERRARRADKEARRAASESRVADLSNSS